MRHTVSALTALLGSLALVSLPSCGSTLLDKLDKARRGAPEDVREAVGDLGSFLSSIEAEGIPFDEGALSAIEYLKELAGSSVDPQSRAQALAALARLKRPDFGGLFASVLTDDAWFVRYEAARGVARHPRALDAEPLVQRLGRERRVEVQLEVVRALAEVRGDVALKALLEAFLDSRFEAMRLTVYDAVVKVSGKSFPRVPRERWTQYFRERFPAESPIEPTAPTSATSS